MPASNATPENNSSSPNPSHGAPHDPGTENGGGNKAAVTPPSDEFANKVREWSLFAGVFLIGGLVGAIVGSKLGAGPQQGGAYKKKGLPPGQLIGTLSGPIPDSSGPGSSANAEVGASLVLRRDVGELKHLVSGDLRDLLRRMYEMLQGSGRQLAEINVKVDQTVERGELAVRASQSAEKKIISLDEAVAAHLDTFSRSVERRLAESHEHAVRALTAELRAGAASTRDSLENARALTAAQSLPTGRERFRAAVNELAPGLDAEDSRSRAWSEPVMRLARALETLGAEDVSRPDWIEQRTNQARLQQVLFAPISNGFAPLVLDRLELRYSAALRDEVELYQKFLLDELKKHASIEPITASLEETYDPQVHEAQGEGVPVNDRALHNRIQKLLLPGLKVGGKVIHRALVQRYVHRGEGRSASQTPPAPDAQIPEIMASPKSFRAADPARGPSAESPAANVVTQPAVAPQDESPCREPGASAASPASAEAVEAPEASPRPIADDGLEF